MVERIPYDKLEIGTGWLLVDLKTTEDCDEATVHLTREIASIESQIDEAGDTADGQWLRKARAALKIKNVMRGLAVNRRKDIVRASQDQADYARRVAATLTQDSPNVRP